ncbi:MAG: tRNA (adenosine(37)-N6)-threonylcarbamoyltransferase complex dimerization subunit type 1 TsaB [Anaerolineaceae bacterium 4572_5.1]|nr:MAG: tRNA (adenosine(37)-N6)-threonylcarbamoyltransferase complex dimerization subunit type 1 TsaB [Anaerolineaceae bacterium 4572_5.1]
MLLAVDTSTRAIGVALYDGSRVLSAETWVSDNYHTVELAQSVADNLSRVGVEPEDLEAVAVALGPGSFTGLRIGLAFAKGIAFPRGLPLVGIPTLDVVASSQALNTIPLAAVLQAGRKRLAVGWYIPGEGSWQSSNELENLSIEELGEKEAIREALKDNTNAVLASPAHALRNPAFLAELAWERLQAGDVDDAATLSPIYLHRGDPIPG